MSSIFELDSDNLADIRFVNPKLGWQDFEVDASNYDSEENYYCENGHQNLPKPALLSHSTSFNPKTGDFEISGTVVFVCGICKSPLQSNE